MKKIFISIFIVFIAFTHSFSQDVITKKTEENLQAKVLEIGPTEIKYKRFDNPDGPTYTILKSDVIMIRYENGSKDIFDEDQYVNNTSTINTNTNDLFVQGQLDAMKYYKGYRGAGTATLIIGLLSPLAGLVPAIACSSTYPNGVNLMCPNSDLMKKTDYYNGYSTRAKKIKSGKVWSNWGIAFGVNLGLVLVMMSGQ
ncbi:MAG: hypothetical protein HGB12_09295 [Bacteroidetes bacterium]|nr:hypothetical protein [Bacteroidota bacterium]